MTNKVEYKVRDLLKENVELDKAIEQITGEDDLINLGMDSINVTKLIVAIENEFGFEFDDESLSLKNFRNLNLLVACVESRILK